MSPLLNAEKGKNKPQDPGLALAGAREAIDSVDRRLLELIRERMAVAEQVASAKIESASAFRDQRREDDNLRRVRRMAQELGLDPHQLEHIYRLIMEMSIAHQLAHVRDLKTQPLRVAYQGVEGSFSHLTAQRHYGKRTGGTLLSGFESFREAADGVLDGSHDVALLPIENSTAGSINETYDLLARGGLTINHEVISQVVHCLLGLPGAEQEQLRVVLSHPQALMQCEDFFRRHPAMRPQAEFDTAGAARKVRDGRDPTVGAIASDTAATVFGLEILARNIQNQQGNYTRFVEVAQEAATCPPDVPCKTSLLLAIGHEPGDLSDVLRHFSSRGVNLSKLESRPVPETPFSYRFYLDVQGHRNSSGVSEALEAIKPHTSELRVLGTYPAGTPQSLGTPPSDDEGS